jgi:hypothetical protein
LPAVFASPESQAVSAAAARAFARSTFLASFGPDVPRPGSDAMRVDRLSPRQRTASSEPGVRSSQLPGSVVEVVVAPGCELVDVVELDACAEVVDVVVDPSGRDDVVVDALKRVVVATLQPKKMAAGWIEQPT